MSTQQQARSLMARHHHLVKHRQQSLLGRAAAEIGLEMNTVNYWNHIQGKPHPTFRQTYIRSQVSLS